MRMPRWRPTPPLSSTTANILSILTFAFALFASYVALVTATHTQCPSRDPVLVDDDDYSSGGLSSSS